jgi:hypothetical protein
MTNILNYASCPIHHRWNKMAVYSLGIAILQIPALFITLFLANNFGNVLGPILIFPILALLFITPPLSALLGLTASVRTWTSHGTLRGARFGITGFLLAITWPALFITWALPRIFACC